MALLLLYLLWLLLCEGGLESFQISDVIPLSLPA